MPVKINSAGGGAVTLAAASTASEFTHTLPAANGTMIVADSSNNVSISNNLSFNSGFGSSAIAYGCRAWVSFNGTSTVSIRASGNVSSITDNGTGDYTVNFTNAMPDANYSYTHVYSSEVNVQHAVGFLDSISAAALRIRHYNAANSGNNADKAFVLIAVFR